MSTTTREATASAFINSLAKSSRKACAVVFFLYCGRFLGYAALSFIRKDVCNCFRFGCDVFAYGKGHRFASYLGKTEEKAERLGIRLEKDNIEAFLEVADSDTDEVDGVNIGSKKRRFVCREVKNKKQKSTEKSDGIRVKLWDKVTQLVRGIFGKKCAKLHKNVVKSEWLEDGAVKLQREGVKNKGTDLIAFEATNKKNAGKWWKSFGEGRKILRKYMDRNEGDEQTTAKQKDKKNNRKKLGKNTTTQKNQREDSETPEGESSDESSAIDETTESQTGAVSASSVPSTSQDQSSAVKVDEESSDGQKSRGPMKSEKKKDKKRIEGQKATKRGTTKKSTAKKSTAKEKSVRITTMRTSKRLNAKKTAIAVMKRIAKKMATKIKPITMKKATQSVAKSKAVPAMKKGKKLDG